uniref:Immunoglobulin superfamily, member 5a n=1 Tax=Neogobius melanostomus TaxID=47308 RepID=A0A8C6TWR9_9GOBI
MAAFAYGQALQECSPAGPGTEDPDQSHEYPHNIMTVFGKSWPELLCLCLLLGTTEVVFGQFELQPITLTALRGSEVQFNATVTGSWPFMTWAVGKFLVLTIPSSVNYTSSKRYFAQRYHTGTNTARVVFTIHNVTRNDSGPVTCTVQGDYGFKTAQLSVQEIGSVGILGGGNRTVQQEEQVEFQCKTFGWFPAANISWTLNGYAVNSSLVNTTDVGNEVGYNSTSVYKFTAIRNTIVTCLAPVPRQGPISSSVQLVVVPKPTDWTVLIAIVLSFSLVALVVLLIIGLIFCYKRRKEKQLTYKAEMMRQRTQSQLSNGPDSQRQGQENPVFTIDGLPPSEQDSRFSQTNGSFSRWACLV